MNVENLSVRRSTQGVPRSAVANDVAESLLANLVDEITQRLNAGETIDIDEYVDRYPDIADTLACVLETLMLVRQSTASDGASPASSFDHPETTIGLLGDFRILREIGRGGMGVVYEAEQISLGRRVALKVLPFAAMLDRQQLARFKNEARAAATLDHPNIVAIYSVGVERSVHFYAMQLIEGQSLAQVVEQLRAGSKEQGAGGNERESEQPACSPPLHVEGLGEGCPAADTAPIAALSTLPDFNSKEYFRSVAKLGTQAAEALDHAHQNGILHRDIKPANLLVDDAGKLWITDFGLARMETDADMTMTGDILGTLRYMSPEQALAKRVVVDHRSDIYSLGVTLYELLTLQPAFASDDRQELLHQIAFDDPRPLRQINSYIPQDLNTIILKAIEKNPDDRYATAQQLADDFRRLLDERPIKARPQSLTTYIRKWSRRHRPIVISACVSSIALMVMGIVILTISNERIRAESAAKEAALKEKDAALVAARRAVDRMLVQVSEGALKEVPSATSIRFALLQDALDFYEGILSEGKTDIDLRKEMALALGAIAYVQRKLERPEDEQRSLERATQIWRELVNTNPHDPRLREMLAGAEQSLGYVVSVNEPTNEKRVAEHYQNALSIFTALERDYPERPQAPGMCLSYFAQIARGRNERRKAYELWSEAVRQNEEYLKFAEQSHATGRKAAPTIESSHQSLVESANIQNARDCLCYSCVWLASLLDYSYLAEAESYIKIGLDHAAITLKTCLQMDC